MDATIEPIDNPISIVTSNKDILEGDQTHAPHVDVGSDDEKILEGMSRAVLTSGDMVESIFQDNELYTALDLDPVTTLVGAWAEPFHKTTELTESDCLGKALEDIHFSSGTESLTYAHIRTCRPVLPSSSRDSYEYGRSMLSQPETRPISQEQLVNEVKGIYAGLIMVEKNCVDICRTQISPKWIRSMSAQELRFEDLLSLPLSCPCEWLPKLALKVYLVPIARDDITRSLNKQCSVYLRSSKSLSHRLYDMDNRYKTMFYPNPCQERVKNRN